MIEHELAYHLELITNKYQQEVESFAESATIGATGKEEDFDDDYLKEICIQDRKIIKAAKNALQKYKDQLEFSNTGYHVIPANPT